METGNGSDRRAVGVALVKEMTEAVALAAKVAVTAVAVVAVADLALTMQGAVAV